MIGEVANAYTQTIEVDWTKLSEGEPLALKLRGGTIHYEAERRVIESPVASGYFGRILCRNFLPLGVDEANPRGFL